MTTLARDTELSAHDRIRLARRAMEEAKAELERQQPDGIGHTTPEYLEANRKWIEASRELSSAIDDYSELLRHRH